MRAHECVMIEGETSRRGDIEEDVDVEAAGAKEDDERHEWSKTSCAGLREREDTNDKFKIW